MFEKLFDRLKRHFLGRKSFRKSWRVPEQRYFFERVEGKFPPELKTNTLYVLTENDVPWEAALICPCGCGERIELNLLPDEHPRWSYNVTRSGLPSLHPSVNRYVGCKSHFFLRRGRIVWAFL